jgi:N-acetylglucosaminyldiphosphoundecaprenol N-acetyl-beta-D-mannosaminyltransferase
MDHTGAIAPGRSFAPSFNHVDFLGVRIDLLTSESLLELVGAAIWNSKRLLIGHHNLHGLSTITKAENNKYRRFFEMTDVALADGMSMVALGKLLGKGISRNNRIAYNDWLPKLLTKAVEQKWRVFYLGSVPEVAERGQQVLANRFPGLDIICHHGHFDAGENSEENLQVCEAMNAFHPDILFVGMGMPRQEKWLVENHRKLNAAIILTSGATLDYIAGAKKMAPRWMGVIGLEWAFRLAAEPTRLAYRYLIEPWQLVYALASKRMSLKS